MCSSSLSSADGGVEVLYTGGMSAPLPPSSTSLPTWTAVWWRISATAVVFWVCIAAFFVLDHPGELGVGLAQALGIYIVTVILLAMPLSMLATAPIERLRRQLVQGTDTAGLVSHDVVAAMQLPLRVFFLSVGVGFVITVFVAIGAASIAVLQPHLLVAAVGGAAIAVISATVQGYAVYDLVNRRIAPVLLPTGRLDHLGDVPTLRIWQHLALLTCNLAVAWPAIAVVVATDGTAHVAAAIVPLVVLYLITGVVQVTGTMRVISRNVGHLQERLEQVRRGDLTAQATIYGLDTFGVVMSDFNKMVEGLRQREQLKETFGRYVTKQVADEILAGRVALGGELRTATVLFSDIRGFTSMSEHLAPAEVVAFLNEYLTAMVDCVIEHGGVLDKFIGDAVLAVFGAPVSAGSPEADARAAVACAVAMGKKLDEMNAARQLDGRAAIGIGIGVHTGELVAGNIGSPKRMQYTVIGDTVNVGSRLESLTKEHKRRTLVSSATAALIGDSVALLEVGTVVVRGRQEPLLIFGLCNEGALA